MRSSIIAVVLGIGFAVLASAVFAIQSFAVQATSGGASPTHQRYIDKVAGKGAWADWYIEQDANGIYTNVYELISDRNYRFGCIGYPTAVVEASVYPCRLEQVCDVHENGEEY